MVKLTYDNYILVVYADGTMFEGVYTPTGIRCTLTEKERAFIDVLWKLYIYDRHFQKKFKKAIDK